MSEDPRLAFRAAMSNLGAAVNVITSDGPGGRVGFTATAVCSISDLPPSLLVCMNSSSAQNKVFQANGTLCVNTLTDEHRDLSAVFAGMTPTSAEERFKLARWITLATGAPVLENALASFDCEISAVNEVGSHTIFICAVKHTVRNESANGLMYFRRDYHSLGREQSRGSA